jgi:serine phosphatase RsbU (regulator of sigma subunit)
MILAFSDGATEVRPPGGAQLTAKGFGELAEKTVKELPRPLVLADFSNALLRRLEEYRGRDAELEDDVTLLTLRRKLGVIA